VRDGLLFSRAEVSSPLVIADDIPLLDVLIHRLNRTRDGIVKCCLRGCEERAKTQ
jgi:hypothetical protein